MENNKLLIGVQFTRDDEVSYNIELYVPRDILFRQLLEGIKYGLKKLSEDKRNSNAEIYKECVQIFDNTANALSVDSHGRTYFEKITVSSCNLDSAKDYYLFVNTLSKSGKKGQRAAILGEAFSDDAEICDMGFITSTRLIFDNGGALIPDYKGGLRTSQLIAAFDPTKSGDLFFPQYNVSTRLIYQFNTDSVDIISPSDPPQKPNNNIFFMILPSIITIGIMILVRSFFSIGGLASGLSMVVMSVSMGVVGVLTSLLSWNRQKRDYQLTLRDWRNHYEDYINDTVKMIKGRQHEDSQMLNVLYPDIIGIIKENNEGIYSANSNMYSRASKDDDFLTVRLGVSNRVNSIFEIHGDSNNVIFSEAFFDIVNDRNGFDHYRLFVRDEIKEKKGNKANLSTLPSIVSERYKYMDQAPLLYSIKNKSCLGIVDANIGDGFLSMSHYIMTRMIFELCYYHSPEELQFVIFFPESDSWKYIEWQINMYKFMPHFHGLFDDKSQFVFDKENADLLMGSLLSIMNQRKENENTHLPHIVFLVMDEHGLKEHAFAEYLPSASKDKSTHSCSLGLSFVFIKRYKEYLPSYCDDIMFIGDDGLSICSREDVNSKRYFWLDEIPITDKSGRTKYLEDYFMKLTLAFRFCSTMYYSRIAQNGKVPSSVSFFEMINCGNGSGMAGVIEDNWHMTSRASAVKTSLSVVIGKTESDLITLDLHEKADGPHMLVAGTTGSGKTETIISFLLGLCMKYRPDEVNLLLVDMKGGGFTKRLGGLPHVVGAVTDVDGDENGMGAEYMLNRFLIAVKSEIKRRKMLFNKLEVDSIDAYIEACENIEAHIQKKQLNKNDKKAKAMIETALNSPLTHLFLVVDEFTELKRFSNDNDVDFIGEITTIARIGRSLGFHILLISQNIEGAITDDIRVNSNARLCLRVATKQASKEMIGNELAASPYMPGNGRAYLLVGTGTRFEYFQSGYSGSDVEEDIPISITLASKCGSYIDFYKSDKDNLEEEKKRDERKKKGLAKTQLEVITEAINTVYKKHESEFKIHQVYSAPLPRRIVLLANDEIKVLNPVEEE